jgi:2-amino-4-hydroxy-6-hydroxymethyldihydropteridine diphosphokinase
MARVYIGLGSNLGDRALQIQKAVELIGVMPSTKILRMSSIYETSPVGIPDQPRFLNAVIELSTPMVPRELLAEVKKIEKDLGRSELTRWGPRTIDLDILLCNDDVIVSDELTIPHPRMTERKFVLVPLAELDPAVVHPVEQKTVETILARCLSTEEVVLYAPAPSLS